jgi:Spy/CpxP family protein refolding chaperone
MQQNRPPDYRALREYLGLSETQLRRMEMARERASREAGEKEKSLRPQIEEKRLALDELMEGSNPDATVVGRAMLEIRGLERQIRQAHERARTAELSLLTPEQRTKFKAIQDAANLPEATRQAQSLGLVPGPAQPPRILQDPPQPRMLQGPPQPRPPAR